MLMKIPGNKTKGFKCPNSLVLKAIEQHRSKYKVNADGLLKLTNNLTWENDHFCFGFQENVSTAVFQLTFRVCSPPDNCPNHEHIVHMFNVSISIVFLLLTIAVFFWYKNINVYDRSNMMKIAYMVNLTIAYCIR